MATRTELLKAIGEHPEVATGIIQPDSRGKVPLVPPHPAQSKIKSLYDENLAGHVLIGVNDDETILRFACENATKVLLEAVVGASEIAVYGGTAREVQSAIARGIEQMLEAGQILEEAMVNRETKIKSVLDVMARIGKNLRR